MTKCGGCKEIQQGATSTQRQHTMNGLLSSSERSHALMAG